MYCCYICHRAINSKANRLHIQCRITSTSFQSITTFIYLEVQILTAFLFHSLHHVALRITLTSITCLPLQGLPTVNSVCPLSSQDSSSLNSNSPSQQHKIRLPNNAPMELPNGLSPPSLHKAVEAFTRLKGFGLAFSYYSPFFTLSGQGSTISQPSAWQADALPIELYPQKPVFITVKLKNFLHLR